MKKLVAIVLSLMMLAGTAAFAEEHLANYYNPPAINEGQYPIAEKDVKLTYWMPINAGAAQFIANYDENPSYQKAQADTGVDIEFIHPASGNDKEAFGLLTNVPEKMPDMIQMTQSAWYNGGLEAMYNDGLIIDITPYLEQYAPQYKAVTEYNDLGYRQTHQDGKVLGFWKITYADKMPYNRFNVNKTWLDEAGMKEPKTIEEYEAWFDWILQNKEGVVPVYILMDNELNMNLTMGAFDFIYNWYLDPADGKTVKHWSYADQYKDWLELMNRWFEKGYLSKDFASLTLAEAQNMFDTGKLATITDSVDATFNRAEANGLYTVSNLPYMRKAEDSVLGSNLPNTPVGDGGQWVTVITTACKNVEAAVQYLNYGYTYEGALTFTFGIEGTHWNWGEDGIPKFTDEILNNPLGMTISNVSYALKCHFASKYCYPDDIGHPGVASKPEALQIRTMWAGDTNEQNFLQMPPVTLTSDEASELADIMAQVDTYTKEMMYKFITGAEPLENYDAYLKELEALDIYRAAEIEQDAVNRFYAD